MSIYLVSFIALFILKIVYLQIAKKLNIVDKPNHRSSHKTITIRGGGIVFPISILLYFMLSGFQYPLFVLGVFIISLVSFIDDIKSLSASIRLFFQFISILFVLFQLSDSLPLVYMPIVLFIFLGGVNAYNFMDGINGITVSYSLVLLLTFYFLNSVLFFVDNNLIIFILLSIIVFAFFNFRIRALCFSGDVGSVSIALIVLFLLLKLIIDTGEPIYALLLSIYAIDSGCTLLYRKFKGEDIFKPHRSHLYQKLIDHKGYSHLMVSLLYSSFQLTLNYLIIFHISKLHNKTLCVVLLLSILIFSYIVIKRKLK